MEDAAQESNLVQVGIANTQPNLWTDELYEIELTEGDSDYPLPDRMIAIQAAYLTTTSGGSSSDRILWPISVFEWSSLPNKTQQAPPTQYWFDRKITPVMHLWPVPDLDDVYTLKLRICRQVQDVSIPSGTTLDLPYRWLDFFVADLAYRLSRIYKPELEAMRKQDSADAWTRALVEDQERTPIYVSPDFSGYYR